MSDTLRARWVLFRAVYRFERASGLSARWKAALTAWRLAYTLDLQVIE